MKCAVDCPWHGWNVVNACMGQVDNKIGAAGPAGPVANLLAIHYSGNVFNTIQAITVGLFSDAKIINMSFSLDPVPAILFFTRAPFDFATQRANAAGKLLFAAAGNDGEDIDAEDCFLFACWEETWWSPCENDGVVCVGAMDAGGPYRRGNSNYGDEELDTWGPGSVWVGGDYGDNSPHVFAATSAASPFVAGVAALIWAANPRLDNHGVERILHETSHHGVSGQVKRWPDAYAATLRALGGTPPEIAIDARWETSVQIFGACRPQYLFTASVVDPDHGPPIVTWTSDIDHVLGTGTWLTLPLSDGTHHVTATAVDGIGLSTRSNQVVLTVQNPGSASAPKPAIDIISLTNHQKFAANQNITFEAGGFDPASPGGLIAANVSWTSSKDGELGSGQRMFRKLSRGAHYISVSYTGKCGATADDLRLIEVTAAVADAPPNMTITTPRGGDITLYTGTGEACLAVDGFGFDEEDRESVFDWWETNRNDVQWKVLSFIQTTTVCLKLAANGASTVHEIRLRGTDSTGHSAYSSPVRVTVRPGPR